MSLTVSPCPKVACSRIGVAVATLKGSNEETITTSLADFEEKGVAVRGAVVADIDSALGGWLDPSTQPQ